jgi:hypothetical protein
MSFMLLEEDWSPDDGGMGDLNSFMATERTKAPAPSGAFGGAHNAYGASSSAFGGAGGRSAPRNSKAFFDDDDIDTLLALKPTDLLRSAMVDDVDGDEVDMTSLMRSVAIGNAVAPPPGLGMAHPPGLGYPSGPTMGGGGGGGGGYGQASAMPPGLNVGRQAPIGSPVRGGGPPGLGFGSSGSGDAFGKPSQPANVVPKPPQLTPDQLAALTPQQLMNMEQWNLLYQQQQMREVQEQHAQQLAAQRQQQAHLLAQHQQMLAQREEAAKRAAAQADADTDASSEGGDGEFGAASGTSKANKRGRWAGKATARMSPYEIDLIIRSMEHQVATQNPFLDDYYHQNVRIMLNPNNYTTHRPICDVAPPKRRQLDKDPFVGCLGRISSGSSRAPRITVVLDQEGSGKIDRPSAYDVLASDKPFSASLGHMAQPGGVKVSDERRLMLTIEDAFVILLELEDLKQLQHLHIHASRQPSLKSNAQEEQKANEKEAQKKDSMIMEHLHQIISLLAIPRMGAPESHPSHPVYAKWEAFILAILRIPKGARMFARLLLLLPGAVAVSVLRVFVRHLTELASLSVQEDHVALVNIGDYIRRVFLQADLDLLDPMISSLWDDSTTLFAHLSTTISTKVGFYLLNALLSRVNDLKGKPDITRDPRFLPFLPKFLKLHSTFLETLRGQLGSLLATASQNTTRKDTVKVASVHVTVIAPSNPRHIKPLTRSTKSSPYTSEAQMWEFIFYMMLCSPLPEKKNMHAELNNQLSVNSITAETPMDIVNLKTTFTGVLAQQSDPGFDALYKQAQQFAAMQSNPQSAAMVPPMGPMVGMPMGSQPRMNTPPPGFSPNHNQMQMPPPGMMGPPPGMVMPMGFAPVGMNPGAMFAPHPGNNLGNSILQSMGPPPQNGQPRGPVAAPMIFK